MFHVGPEPMQAAHPIHLRSRGAACNAGTSCCPRRRIGSAHNYAFYSFSERHEEAIIGALVGYGPGWGHEQAAVAAAASGSSVAGAAEEPLLSDNVPMMCPPDVEDVPLPKKVRRWHWDAEEGIVAKDVSEEAVWDPLGLHQWHNKRQKVESSAVAGKESPAVADNDRTPGLQISWPGFRGNCTMHFMESRQKEDEEVSSQATTLQLGAPGRSRWEEFVCLGFPHCENFDCDLCENPSETEVEDVKEDDTPHIYLPRFIHNYHSLMEREEIYDLAELLRLSRGEGKGRSGGRAAPKQDRKAKDKEKGKEKGKEADPCCCVRCMSQETYDLYIKDKEKAKDKKKTKEK